MNTSAPMMTVLMPVHNGAEYLRASVESILGQTYRDFELLVVNDGSTDGTPELLAQFAADDPRVRVIGGTTRLGFSGALNLGLTQARGALIARMDADDIALPDRLAVQSDFLRTFPEVGLCGGRVQAFGLRKGTFHCPPLTAEETLCYALFDNPFAHPTIMLRRELVNRHGMQFDPAYCPSDDYELWSRCVRLFPCTNINRVLLHYRVHARSMSEADWGEMDRLAARIAARELAALGLPTDEATTRFHRNLGRGRCFPIRQREELIQCEEWLQTLITANASRARYPAATFRRTAGDIWFRACYHAGALGPWMFIRYARSPLRHARSTSLKEWLALGRMALNFNKKAQSTGGSRRLGG
jgi:glycosyltransferase involved in cell wall biosynthesis